MAWVHSPLTTLVIIWSVLNGLGLCCYYVELFKLVNGPPFYIEQAAPLAATRGLGACSNWCADSGNCQFFSWSPGQCVQVGSTGSQTVTTTVYIVTSNLTVPGR